MTGQLAGIDLGGQVVIVTGGSRGLGLAMARAYAAAGATVVVASRKQQACEDVAAELTAQSGNPAAGIGCHVGRWDDCDALVAGTLERFGRIDVLVNNAGMSPLYPSLEAVTESLFDKVIDVNLKGAFRLSALAGTHMASANGGVIINVTSTAAIRPGPGELPYAAAKAGLNTLTLGLAHAFGPTVRVNAIMPGMFRTDVSKAWDQDHADDVARTSIALRRIAEPEEIVGAALYLASDASSYTTGAILKVDGGLAY